MDTKDIDDVTDHTDPTLVRTGRLFGGLINDIKRKAPFYPSDLYDGLSLQTISSFFFMYFACLAPIITFGGLLGAATDKNMAAMESLLSGAICGISYHLFAGQPLTIIGSTGPVLVFEKILYHWAHSHHLDYLGLRCWVGLWICLILVVIVAFDLSSLVRYITRFTEESFAFLIAMIFIVEAFKKLWHILDIDPVNLHPSEILDFTCWCYPPNTTIIEDGVDETTQLPSNNITSDGVHWPNVTQEACEELGGVLLGPGCGKVHYIPDVFFWSCLLFIFTFTMCMTLKLLRDSPYFHSLVRRILADFAVMISITCMVLLDLAIGLGTPKLDVPTKFQPTLPSRGWLINPFKNPLWTIPAAILPALVGTILIFMDQQITAVIVNRKENKLKKGGGYHLDLFIIALQIGVCSILGIPYFVAATVLSITHVRSLSLVSDVSAPGERPKFLGVREQRVTGVLVFILIGFSVFMTNLLSHIPMPVLYGVFLYMGVNSLQGVQLLQRISILFMPEKHQPDYIFLRHVPVRRVHLFTIIQITCLVALWVIKTTKSISIVFPIMVLCLCGIRKLLEFIFTQHELRWLDDIMPEFKKKEKEDKILMKKEAEFKIKEIKGTGKSISTDVSETALWKSLNQEAVANSMRQRKVSYGLKPEGIIEPVRFHILEEHEDENEPELPEEDSPGDRNQLV